jgi:methylthioribulose-1-phosphate dehydratase
MVLHCHSPSATVLSMVVEADVLELQGYELIKAFRGYSSHESTLSIPIVENTQYIPDMVKWVEARLAAAPDTPAYLIRGHGVYVWGTDESECMRQLEALDFLFQCELQRRLLAS